MSHSEIAIGFLEKIAKGQGLTPAKVYDLVERLNGVEYLREVELGFKGGAALYVTAEYTGDLVLGCGDLKDAKTDSRTVKRNVTSLYRDITSKTGIKFKEAEPFGLQNACRALFLNSNDVTPDYRKSYGQMEVKFHVPKKEKV